MALVLDKRMQAAVHHLLIAEPEAGSLLPHTALQSLGRLIRCDRYGVGESSEGYNLRLISYPHLELNDLRVCARPVARGLVHDASLPAPLREAADEALLDQIRLGFKTPAGTTIQLYFERRRMYFSPDDVALLAMVAPAIARLARAGGAPVAAAGLLSKAERQVLALVATGASNREVAEDLCVTVHTVRKHLENAYRKLGVTNRTAAVRSIETHP